MPIVSRMTNDLNPMIHGHNLQGIWHKIDRANALSNELIRAINVFIERHPLTMVTEPRFDTLTEKYFYFTPTEHPSLIEWGVNIQSDGLVSAESGGGEFITSTLMLGERVFIPVPDDISRSFIPAADRTKRLEVRADVLHSRA